MAARRTHYKALPVANPPLCAGGDRLARLAVLGVFSSEARTAFRHHIRSSWMNHTAAPEQGVLARFVLRGFGAAQAAQDEARQHGDIMFVSALARLGRMSGPLATLLGWYACAATVWPRAQLIGKADDDVWVQLSSTATMLAATSASLRASDPNHTEPRMLWGFIERYEWDLAGHRPTFWGGGDSVFARGFPSCRRHKEQRENLLAFSLAGGFKHGNCTKLPPNASRSAKPRCHVERPTVPVVGPFGEPGGPLPAAREPRADLLRARPQARAPAPAGFPKGPMYFVSASIVAELNAHRRVAAEMAATVLSVNDSRKEGVKPWEDVFTGLAVAQAATQGGLAMVHMGCAPYVEAWGHFMAPSALLWHMKSKVPERISECERWSSAHHCDLPLLRLQCRQREWTSCSGAPWRHCYAVYNTTGCSSKLRSLLKSRPRLPGRRSLSCWSDASE